MVKENTPGHRIRAVWLFVAIDTDGDEGLPAFESKGVIIPMVCTDEARVASLRPMAARAARERGVRIELVRFGGEREVLEVWEP